MSISYQLAGITAQSLLPCESHYQSWDWKGRTSSSPPSSVPKTMELKSARQQLIALWRSWRLPTSTSSSSTGRGCRGWTWPAHPTPLWGRRVGGYWRKTLRLASFVQLGSPTTPWTICTSWLTTARWCRMFCKWNFTQSKSRSHFVVAQVEFWWKGTSSGKSWSSAKNVESISRSRQISTFHQIYQCNPSIFPFCGSGLLQPWPRCWWTSAHFTVGCQGSAYLQPS